MYIVRKDRKGCCAVEHITAIYIAGDKCSINCDFQSGQGMKLGQYALPEDAEAALELFLDNIGKTEVFYMLQDDTIRARRNAARDFRNNHNGRKPQRHGGS